MTLAPAIRLVLRSRTALAGAVLTLGWIFAALAAPLLAPHDPYLPLEPLLPPLGELRDGGTAWLGTDMLGRDILSRILWGSRAVLFWSALATGCAYAVGIVMGLIGGYVQGTVDAILSFIANTILSFPVLVLYIIIIVLMGATGLNIVIAVTFASAPAIFRIVRALTMDLRTRDFVAAAMLRGESTASIMAREILPNATGPLFVDVCLRFGYTAITIGVLGFLGLGLPPPTPDWGGMVNEGRSMAMAFPHLVVFPCIAISSLVLGLNLLADGLREALHNR